jgi:DNA ligase-1
MRREFLQLAHTFDNQDVTNWWMSKKLDGYRVFWDGGITRGMHKSSVPWANTEKDERYKKEPIATGLWTRNANVYHAPEWFLDDLPKIPLDGELYCHGLKRQDIGSIVKSLVPGVGWASIKFHVFDSPPLATVFKDGVIDTPHYKKEFKDILKWIMDREYKYQSLAARSENFNYRYTYMLRVALADCPSCTLVHQTPIESMSQIDYHMDEALDEGYEGLVIRNPQEMYHCYRSHDMLKYKPYEDAEGIVVGYTSGRETDKGSRLLGMMGALIVDYGDQNGNLLELSGFEDAERELSDTNFAVLHPGKLLPEDVEAVKFPRGTVVTFKYRGLSNDGVPQEARYWRKR